MGVSEDLADLWGVEPFEEGDDAGFSATYSC